MQNKTNTILLVLIVILLAICAWFLMKNGNTPGYEISDISSTQETNTNPPAPVTVTTKTYTDTNGFLLKYSLNTTMTTSKGFGGDPIVSFNVPFKDNYSKFTGKSLSIQNYPAPCDVQAPYTKRTINGVEYHYLNPAWTDTSGMSSISYFKRYLVERDSRCFMFVEQISGTGTNETPTGATAPADFQTFFDSEMKDLDAIMASVVWSSSVKLDQTSPYVKTYKTLFTKEFSEQANFQGHFRIVAVGCGTECMSLYALDKNTGKVYKISVVDTNGLDFVDYSTFKSFKIVGTEIDVMLQNGNTRGITYYKDRDAFGGAGEASQ